MPSAVSASRTSSSLKGLKIAMTNFIASPWASLEPPSGLQMQSPYQSEKPFESGG